MMEAHFRPSLTLFTLTALYLSSLLLSVTAIIPPPGIHALSPRQQTTGSAASSQDSSTTMAAASSTPSSSDGTSSDSTSSSSNGTSSNSTSGSGSRYVLAHFMVGNSYPYTADDWTEDIKLASAAGIDAFALNIGPDSFQATQVKNAYKAAEQTSFKMLMSFDMTVLPCTSPSDADNLVQYVNTYAKSPAQFKYNGKVLVTTFSGENCNFGQGSVEQGWQSQFTSKLSNILFVPSFMVEPSNFKSYSQATHGQFSWNSAWPVADKAPTNNEQSVTGSLSMDTTYKSALNSIGNQLYIAAVSPWFFTHYGGSLDKNFIYLTDDLYPTRWQSIISNASMFPIIEIITWNDYGESSYIGPIKGTMPADTTWADGFDHTAFLDMTAYFTAAYKNGTTTVQEDKLYIWARPHSKNATASGDPLPKPSNSDVVEDAVFALVMAKESGTVTLSASSSTKTEKVSQGLTQLSMPLKAGDTISATLTRDNKEVLSVKPSNFTFKDSTQLYNFNAFAAMAPKTNLYSGGNSTSSGSGGNSTSSDSSGNSTSADSSASSGSMSDSGSASGSASGTSSPTTADSSGSASASSAGATDASSSST